MGGLTQPGPPQLFLLVAVERVVRLTVEGLTGQFERLLAGASAALEQGGRQGQIGLRRIRFDLQHPAPALDRPVRISLLVEHQGLVVDRLPEVLAQAAGPLERGQGLAGLVEQDVGVAQIEVGAGVARIALEALVEQIDRLCGAVVPQGQGGLGKPDAGIGRVELLRPGQGYGGLLELPAAQLGLRQQQPTAGIGRQQLHGEGGQTRGVPGLAQLEQAGSGLGNSQAGALQLLPLGHVGVRDQGVGRGHGGEACAQGQQREGTQPARCHGNPIGVLSLEILPHLPCSALRSGCCAATSTA